MHCYYEDVYGTRPVARELHNGLVWYYCGLDKPPSRNTINRFLTDLEHVIDDVFERLVVLEASIRYTKLDGEAVYIPVTTIIERDGETVTASRIYGDMAPLYDVDPDEAPLIC